MKCTAEAHTQEPPLIGAICEKQRYCIDCQIITLSSELMQHSSPTPDTQTVIDPLKKQYVTSPFWFRRIKVDISPLEVFPKN